MNEFEKFLRNKHTDGTANRYARSAQLMMDILGKETANTARYGTIIEYIQKLRAKNYSSGFIITELAGIKAYYDYLVKEGIRLDNPAKNIQLKDKSARNIQFQNLFTAEELELLLNRENRYKLLKWKNKLAISLYIYQGLTTGEIASLTTNDLDMEEGSLFIRATRKSNSRLLSLKSKQAVFAERYLVFDRPALIKQETDALFIGKLGNAENGESISYLIESQRGLFPDRVLNAKTIRQSVIVNEFKKGKGIKDVQLFAGHRNPSTTEIYRPTDLSDLSDAIGRYLDLGE